MGGAFQGSMATPRSPRLLTEANLIGGAWSRVHAGGIPVTDPATGKRIGYVPDAGILETRAAIEAAHAALPNWRSEAVSRRGSVLMRLAAMVTEHAEDLACIVTLEQGKPLGQARTEVAMAAEYILWFAEEAQRRREGAFQAPQGYHGVMVSREPAGVVGAITASAFPSFAIASKLGAALAAGCTIVIAPATNTPFSALAWGVMCQDAGLPAGVLNIVTGNVRPIWGELTSHPLVRKIAFTGTVDASKQLLAGAARHARQVSMELISHACVIVFEDADLDQAVEEAVSAKFRNASQISCWISQFLIQEKMYGAFADRLANAVGKLKIGNGFDLSVDSGPLIDAASLEAVEANLHDARLRGAKVLVGGKRHVLGGTFFEPTILIGGPPTIAGWGGDSFSPLVRLSCFRDELDAIAKANDRNDGLACYFYTRDLNRAFRVSAALNYPMVGINKLSGSTEMRPFLLGKRSGFSCGQSLPEASIYLDEKSIWIGDGR